MSASLLPIGLLVVSAAPAVAIDSPITFDDPVQDQSFIATMFVRSANMDDTPGDEIVAFSSGFDGLNPVSIHRLVNGSITSSVIASLDGIPFDPRVDLGDINGDGLTDVVAALGGAVDVSSLLQQQDSTFVRVPTGLTGSFYFPQAVLGHLDDDGIIDLVTTDLSTFSHTHLGLGDGTFTSVPDPVPGGVNGISDPALADINGDSRPDLVIAGGVPGVLSVHPGLGEGLLDGAISMPAPTNEHFVVADFDADGVLDVAFARNADRTGIQLHLGNGDGAFGAPTIIPLGQGALRLAVGDFDADGLPDLAAAVYPDLELTILRNLGNAEFQIGATIVLPIGSHPTASPSINSMSVGDFDADGRPDVALAAAVDGLLIVRNSSNIPCAADLAPSFGTLDFSDVTAFLTGFSTGAAEADLAKPFGVLDFSDVVAFLAAFGAGCP